MEPETSDTVVYNLLILILEIYTFEAQDRKINQCLSKAHPMAYKTWVESQDVDTKAIWPQLSKVLSVLSIYFIMNSFV